MIERMINPKPRFVTLSANSAGSGAPLATLLRQSFFAFDQDSLIHSITINSNFVCSGALSQLIGAVAFSDSTTISVSLPNVTQTALWIENLLNPAAGVISASKSVFIDLDRYFAKSNTQISCYLNGIGGVQNGTINATVSFNTVEEWKNFKE